MYLHIDISIFIKKNFYSILAFGKAYHDLFNVYEGMIHNIFILK